MVERVVELKLVDSDVPEFIRSKIADIIKYSRGKKLTGIAVIMLHEDGSVGTMFSPPNDTMQLLGCEILKRRLLKEMSGE